MSALKKYEDKNSLLYDILNFTDPYNFVIATIFFQKNIFEWIKHFW